jgi:hypothetical protein
MQKLDAITAGQTQATAETQIKDSGAFSQRRIFSQWIAIVIDGFHPIHLGEPGAETLVKLMQRERIHGRNLAEQAEDGIVKI